MVLKEFSTVRFRMGNVNVSGLSPDEISDLQQSSNCSLFLVFMIFFIGILIFGANTFRLSVFSLSFYFY